MKGKNLLPKIGALAMAASIMFTLGAPAFAAGQTYNFITGGDVVIFEKYLSMDVEANVPNVTFNYTIAPGPAQNATAQSMQIFAGNDASRVSGTPTIAVNQATFAVGDTTYTTVQDSPNTMQSRHMSGGSAIKDALTLGANEKYARKDVKINFSGVQFKEPGIYRYIVTEAASDTTHGITDDTDNTRILDIYVVDDGIDATSGNPKLKIEGYVLHNTAADAIVKPDGTSQQDTKAAGFWNKYETENLTLSKAVSGNQASRDEYFEFTVKISNAIAGTKYDVTGNFDQTTKTNGVNTTAHTNPTSITVPAGATEVTQTFWLQNGQNIVINGLAKNSQYDVNENVTTLANEGYTPSAVVTGDTKTGANEQTTIAFAASTASVQDTAITADSTVAYTNTKAGVIPTGVILTIAPFAAVTLLGGAGAATILMKKKREEDEENNE